MSWLGNGFREQAQALSDAYASMYKAAEEADEVVEETKEEPQQLDEKVFKGQPKVQKVKSDPPKPASSFSCPGNLQKAPGGGCMESAEQEILAALQDAYEMMYEKKSGLRTSVVKAPTGTRKRRSARARRSQEAVVEPSSMVVTPIVMMMTRKMMEVVMLVQLEMLLVAGTAVVANKYS